MDCMCAPTQINCELFLPPVAPPLPLADWGGKCHCDKIYLMYINWKTSFWADVGGKWANHQSISDFVLSVFCSIAERKVILFLLVESFYVKHTHTRTCILLECHIFSSPSPRRALFSASSKQYKSDIWITEGIEKNKINQTFTALLFDACITSARRQTSVQFLCTCSCSLCCQCIYTFSAWSFIRRLGRFTKRSIRSSENMHSNLFCSLQKCSQNTPGQTF